MSVGDNHGNRTDAHLTGKREPLSHRDAGRWAMAVVLAAALHLSPLLLVLPLSKVPEIETAKAIEVELVEPPRKKPKPKPKATEKPKPPPQAASKPEPAKEEPKKAAPEKTEPKKPEAKKAEPQKLPAAKKAPEKEKKAEKPKAAPKKKKPAPKTVKTRPKKPKQTAKARTDKKVRAPSGSTSKDPVANWLYVVRSKLRQPNLYPPEAQARRLRGRVVVSFIIDKSGRIVDFWIARSSGSNILDRAAASALVRAVPFPKMPKEMNRQSIKLSYKVEFAPK